MQDSKLDDTDRALLEHLRTDGRASLSALGEDVGLSGDAVRERLRRLQEEGVFQVSATTDPAAMGLTSLAIVGLRVRGEVEAVAQALTEIPEVDLVACTLGSFDVICEVLSEDDLDLMRTVDRSIRSHDNVTDCVVFKSIGLAKWSPGGLAHRVPKQSDETARQLDETDAALIRALQRNGRASFRELGEMTGLDYQSARRRARALLESGAVRIETVINRLVDQNAILAMVGLRAVGPLSKTINDLAEIDEVEVALVTTGPFDLLLEVACQDEDHLRELVGERLIPLPSVAYSETFVYGRVMKLPVTWAFPIG